MDPNATLATIRQAIADYALMLGKHDDTAAAAHALIAIEHFQHLDNWLAAHKGFLPSAWQHSAEPVTDRGDIATGQLRYPLY